MMVVVFLLAFNSEDELAASLLTNHARVLPENVLFRLGDPPLNQNILRILSYYVSRTERYLVCQ